MLITEDLLLLLTDDETGHRTASPYLHYLLAGAVLADLAQGGFIRITEKGESGTRAKRLVVDSQAPAPSDPLLLEYLQMLAEKSSWRPADAVTRMARPKLVRVVAERLVRAELVWRDQRKALGFIPYTRYLAVPGDHEAEVRRRIDVAVLEDGEADFHTAALIALLSSAQGGLKALKAGRDLDMRALRRRAKVLRDQYWAAKAVYDAIQSAGAAAAAGA